MKLDFTGKVVLITGGTSGIGLAAARMFLAAGASVAVMGRNFEKGQAAVQKLATVGTSPLFLCGDVTNVCECERVVRDTCGQFGRLDVLVNSAGEYLEKPIVDMQEEEFDRILSVNIKGSYFVQGGRAGVETQQGNHSQCVFRCGDQWKYQLHGLLRRKRSRHFVYKSPGPGTGAVCGAGKLRMSGRYRHADAGAPVGASG